MGAWGIGSFDNDDASDWVADLKESDPSLIASTLRRITTVGEDYLEAPDCSNALAAAEIVAALRGYPLSDLYDAAQAWVQTHHFDPDADLVSIALAAVERIRSDSELKELWEEVAEGPVWFATLDDLNRRLAAT